MRLTLMAVLQLFNIINFITIELFMEALKLFCYGDSEIAFSVSTRNRTIAKSLNLLRRLIGRKKLQKSFDNDKN